MSFFYVEREALTTSKTLNIEIGQYRRRDLVSMVADCTHDVHGKKKVHNNFREKFSCAARQCALNRFFHIFVHEPKGNLTYSAFLSVFSLRVSHSQRFNSLFFSTTYKKKIISRKK